MASGTADCHVAACISNAMEGSLRRQVLEEQAVRVQQAIGEANEAARKEARRKRFGLLLAALGLLSVWRIVQPGGAPVVRAVIVAPSIDAHVGGAHARGPGMDARANSTRKRHAGEQAGDDTTGRPLPSAALRADADGLETAKGLAPSRRPNG